jgi:hypothetical protein
MIIYNTTLVRIVTFGFARGITIFPFILVRKSERGDEYLLNHERIHIRQQIELLLAGFWIWYLLNFIVNYIRYRKFLPAYENIIFERESYANDHDMGYLARRRLFAFLKYAGV